MQTWFDWTADCHADCCESLEIILYSSAFFWEEIFFALFERTVGRQEMWERENGRHAAERPEPESNPSRGVRTSACGVRLLPDEPTGHPIISAFKSKFKF